MNSCMNSRSSCPRFYTGSLGGYGAYVGSLLNAAFIITMDTVWARVAKWLVDNENHRTTDEHNNALVAVCFAFQFVSNYISLFYVAYVKPNLSKGMFGLSDSSGCKCADGSFAFSDDCCRNELRVQLLSLLVVRQFYGPPNPSSSAASFPVSWRRLLECASGGGGAPKHAC